MATPPEAAEGADRVQIGCRVAARILQHAAPPAVELLNFARGTVHLRRDEAAEDAQALLEAHALLLVLLLVVERGRIVAFEGRTRASILAPPEAPEER